MRRRSAAISIALHLGAVALMSYLGAQVALNRASQTPKKLYVPLDYHRVIPGPTGGGGADDPTPATRGKLPPPATTRVFVPPLRTIADPKLPVSIALIDAPQISVDSDHYGDPLARAGLPSLGPGHRGGSGTGCCGGNGPGDGPGPGGNGQPSVQGRQQRITRPPQLIYKIEPDYPDEARKARYQGTVVLQAIVDPTGHTQLIRVIRGLGLGMDERAIEALTKWRFSPALEGNRPVAFPVTVEISFRLL